MSEEIFVFNLCSVGPYVVNNANLNAVSYNVNWNTILPHKYSKFEVSCNFRSNAYLPGGLAVAGTVLTDVGFIGLNFGKTDIFEGGSSSSNIAMIYPAVTNAIAALNCSYYNCNNNDNVNFTMDFPQSGIITVTLKTYGGVNMANMQNYNLQLSLKGVAGPNIGKANLMSFEKPSTY